MGKIIEFFQNLPRYFEIILVKPQFWIIALLVASAVTFVSVSKSQKSAEHAFVKKVKKIKAKQKAFANEKDKSKLNKLVKQYNNALNSLKKRIRYALWWNKKKIVITNSYLLDNSESANLAINENDKFTFMDVLNSVVEEKNKNSKQKTAIVTKGLINEINTPSKNEIKYETLTEEQKKDLSGEKETEIKKEVVKTDEVIEVENKNLDNNKKIEVVKDDNKDSVYKTKKNIETQSSQEFIN